MLFAVWLRTTARRSPTLSHGAPSWELIRNWIDRSASRRTASLEALNGDRFVDLAPLQIYAQLLDEGVYLCSVSTMYRVLAQNSLLAERRRLARHPAKTCPELVVTAPRQVYSWDITKLAGLVKGTYFDAYVMIDIYSRYLVGVHVHTHESGVLAAFATLSPPTEAASTYQCAFNVS